MPFIFTNKGQSLVFRRCGSASCFKKGNTQHLEMTNSNWGSPTGGFLKLDIIRVCLECKTETEEEIKSEKNS